MESQRTHTPPAPESAPRTTAGNGYSTATDETPADAFKKGTALFGELKEYATYFVGAKVDGIKATLRNVVLYAAIGLVGALIGAVLLITAAVQLMSGLAGAVGAMFNPDRPWAGELIIGFLFIAGTIAAVVVAIKKITGSSRKRTIEKYENRKRDQFSAFGTSVQQRAREQVEQQSAA